MHGPHQENRLEGVFPVVRAAEHPAADAENQRTVPREERRERVVSVTAGLVQEPFDQRPISERSDRPNGVESPDSPEGSTGRFPAHLRRLLDTDLMIPQSNGREYPGASQNPKKRELPCAPARCSNTSLASGCSS